VWHVALCGGWSRQDAVRPSVPRSKENPYYARKDRVAADRDERAKTQRAASERLFCFSRSKSVAFHRRPAMALHMPLRGDS
jgi:hypothetical protein